MNVEMLHSFEDEIRKLVPGFRVGFKTDSKLQQLIGVFARPFNPEYLTRYTSTFYPVVWFSSRENYEGQPRSSLTVLAHELVHLIDTQNHPIWFRLSYLFPQSLAPLAFLVYVYLCGWRAWPLAALLVGLLLSCLLARLSMGAFGAAMLVTFAVASTFAVKFGGWNSVPLFIGLAMLAPWPAPWRVRWELRGYGMSLAVVQWTYRGVLNILRETTVKHFIKADYYFMSWGRKGVEKSLDEYVARAQSDSLRQETPYKQVYDFLAKNGLLQP